MAKDHPTGKSGLYAAFLELETPEECYRFLQDVCSYAELSAMEQRYNIAEKLMRKQSYTSIMGNIGASSAIIWKRTASPLTPKTEFLLTAGALRAGDAPPAVRFFFDL